MQVQYDILSLLPTPTRGGRWHDCIHRLYPAQNKMANRSQHRSIEFNPNVVIRTGPADNPIVQAEIKIEYTEEDAEEVIPCDYCSKTFCNENALQNHVKMQHSTMTGKKHNIDNILFSSPTLNESFQRMSGYGNFKFIPRQDKGQMDGSRSATISNDPQSLVSLASEDVSYIIIKTEGEDFVEPNKRIKRADNTVKRPYNRSTKMPVELTGPFECLQPSNFLPHGTCHQIFFNCCEYSLHYREEHTKRRKAALRCQVCEKRLDQDLDPKSGVFSTPFSQYSDQSVMACTTCGKAFTDAMQFEEHKKTHHVKLKPFQCQICLKRFTQQGGLQQHMRMHTGDRPFHCTFCEKAFTQKAGLDQHLRIHTKIKPFRCVVCSKAFSQSVHLRQHMRTHTNIQPFECGICGRRFKQSSHLNFHLKSHSNDSTEGMTDLQKYQHQQAIAQQQLQLQQRIQQEEGGNIVIGHQEVLIENEAN